MQLLKFPKPTFLLHPSVIAVLTWSSVAFLYSLHLSRLLLYTNADVLYAFLLIVLPILVVSGSYSILRTRVPSERQRFVLRPAPNVNLLHRRLSHCLKLWIACALFETIVSGGLPIVWILIGNGKPNAAYGISSVHGLVNALLLALSVAYFALYLYTGQRRFLRLPLFALLWSILVVSRGTLLVLLLEYIILYLRLRPIKATTLVKLVAIFLVVILLFGYIGDIRTGGEYFRNAAQPTEAFPEWLPSGVLWAYIYITTPLNNLLNTMHLRTPDYNILLPATAATLFPSVIRLYLYGAAAAQKSQEGELQTSAFSVSTAYVGPFQDMGVYGIIGFSVVAALMCEIFWHKSGFWNIFVLSVFTQGLFLSLFYNLLFSLPILGQLLWFYYFTRPPRRSRRPTPTLEPVPLPA